MRKRAYQKKNGDLLLLGLVGALVIIGLIMLSSASSALAYNKFNDSYHFVKAQTIYLLLGLIVLWFMSKVNYHVWRPFAWYLWLLSLILLALVFVPQIGVAKNNVRSWLDIGIITFQPVELVKLFFIIYLATWLADKSLEQIKSWREGLLPFLFSSGIILLLILFQPDFGSMILVFLIACAIFYMSGASLKELAVIGGITLLALPLLVIFASYRYKRLTAFLHPEQDLSGLGYHLHQALIAIGSGGWLGRGFGKSVQKFQYLPEAAGDSIFAVIAEEMGFLFAVFLVILFVALLYRGLKIASLAPDVYGKLLATGLIAWLTLQAFINIGSITGLLPLTGLPLPFISQGGTALITSLAAVGILFNISKQGIIR